MVQRGDIIVIIVILWVITFTPGPSLYDADSDKNILARYNEERQISRDILFNSTYSSGYGNVTGFRLSYLDAVEDRNVSLYPFPDRDYRSFKETEEYSILPNEVSTKANAVWKEKDDNPVYMRNLSASFYGEFHQSTTNFTRIDMPLPEYLSYQAPDYPFDFEDDIDSQLSDSDSASPIIRYDNPNEESLQILQLTQGNISTVRNGKLTIEVKTSANEENSSYTDVLPISINLRMADQEENNWHYLSLSGLYFTPSGNIFGLTKSSKFQSTYALPHLMLNEANFEQVKQYMVTKYKYIQEKEEILNVSVSSLKNDIAQAEKCEYLMYLQLGSINLTRQEVQMFEDEMTDPIGRPISKMPELTVKKGIVFSPDCGVVAEFDNVSGPLQIVHVKRLRKLILITVIVFLAQLYLLIRQVNRTNIAPLASRISYYALAQINLVDGTCAMILIYETMLSLHVPLAGVLLLLVIFLCVMFEWRYMLSVYLSQINETSIGFWTALRGAPQSTSTTQTTNADGLPQPVLQPTTVVEDEETVSSSLYARSFLTFFFCSFLVGNVTSWNVINRGWAEKFLLIIANSYWYPQIVRNVARGVRVSFSWEFMVGMSILRLIPVYYVLGYRDNVFRHHTDIKFLAALTVWTAVPLSVILLQQISGPRLLIPKRFLPKLYNYHPVLSLDDLENGFGVDCIKPEEQESGKPLVCSVDCAICMNKVEIEIKQPKDSDAVSDTQQLLGETVASGDYMVTPCKHIFHSECLKSWMSYKLQCPVCRNSLPPV